MHLNKILLCCLLFAAQLCAAQGFKGFVKDAKNEPVGFVTIYCKEQKKSTNSNADGSFQLPLPAGNHIVYFQSVGYKTKAISITVESGFTQQNVVMEEQAYALKEVNVQNGGTNPAVWIMRKAIAAAPYYRRQILAYDAKMYIKGSGKIDAIPFLFEKLLKKEGISEGQTFLVESINEVSFKQPNTFTEKALSIKSSIPTEGAPQPLSMVRGSLYQTSNMDLISPLSPQAFSVYTFTLEGSFYEDGREVNRIKVTPKRKGDDVFKGYIYIMEGLWCIHSTDLVNDDGDFETKIITSFRPVAGYDFVRMPVTYDIRVKGGKLGFKGSFRYLVSARDYKIKLNPNLDHDWVKKQTKEVVQIVKDDDQKPEKKSDPAKPKTKRQAEIETLLAKEELTKMEMLKLATKMKKESESEQEKSLEIKSDSSTMVIDSMATKRDSSFWIENRPVALMDNETVSYKQFDSVMTEKAKAKAKDSTSRHKNDTGFQFTDIIFGTNGTFNHKRNFYEWGGLLSGSEIFVNTVDGWGASFQWKIGSVREDGKIWTFTNRIRIPFERKTVNTFGDLVYWYNPRSLSKVTLSAGSYVNDFNATGGPSMFVNTTILVFDQRNLMKLYQQEYVRLSHQMELANGFLWDITGSWHNRYALWNTDRFAKKETPDGKITPNTPTAGYTFPTHQALILANTFTYTPEQRYRIVKGRKEYVQGKMPTLQLKTTYGIKGQLSSDVDFMKMDLMVTERIKPLHWLFINARLAHQFFVYNNQSYFPDYNQVVGNQSPFFTGDALSVFRQLDYYDHANTSSITTLNTELDFKRLLVKRLPLINMTGIREVIFYNGLYTPSNKTYQEIGYSVDGIIGVFRVDVFAGFKNTTYNNWGVRLIMNIDGLN
jgi:hypothetical protein